MFCKEFYFIYTLCIIFSKYLNVSLICNHWICVWGKSVKCQFRYIMYIDKMRVTDVSISLNISHVFGEHSNFSHFLFWNVYLIIVNLKSSNTLQNIRSNLWVSVITKHFLPLFLFMLTTLFHKVDFLDSAYVAFSLLSLQWKHVCHG